MKYVHTNLIAKDWKALSKFYQKVFNCKPLGNRRNLSGEWLKQLTGLENITITGEHLSLPGYRGESPTLEIFSYSFPIQTEKHINSFGFSHIAFQVDDVETTANLILNEGGALLGEIVEKDYGDMGIGVFAYATDLEGNYIELQSWK
ncbi:VOC family protein [Miniphocaeibacter massiliensis]|uniref:VOC family protein n=1 Tax=Miniphocaeibacter massiliensis TaxID=2041841 RepID=UPI001A9147A3|nr:VOC family protein [Miniphocaeibacter massiliensis]